MAQQIFLSSSKFSAPVMTLDSRDTQKHGRAAWSPSNKKIWRLRTHLPYFMWRAVHTSNFSYVSTFIPSHRKYIQSECRKAVVYSKMLHPTFPSCPARTSHRLCLPLYFIWMAQKIKQRSLVVYNGIKISSRPIRSEIILVTPAHNFREKKKSQVIKGREILH